MPDLPTLSTDVLTDPDLVNSMILDRVENQSVFRNAFQNQDVSGVNDDEFSFYVDDGVYDSTEIEVVEEGSEIPSRRGDRRKVRVQRHKYAEEYEITMEGELDDAAGETAIEAERKMRRMANTMDAVAFETMNAAIARNDHGTIAPSGENGQIGYDDVVDAIALSGSLAEGEYAPSQLYVDHRGLADIRKMDEFTHATSDGDELIQTGRVGQISGLTDIYVSNSPFINMGSGEALLVDPNWFGREAEWLAPTVDRGSDFTRQVPTIMQMYGLIGFVSTHPNAATRIGN